MDIVVDDLQFNSTATVFKIKRRLAKTYIQSIFAKASKNKIGNYLLKEVRSTVAVAGQDYYYSIMVYRLKESPSFLLSVKNELHAFLLLVEIGDYVFVIKEKVKDVNSLLSDRLEKLAHEEICLVGGGGENTFEAISLKALSIGKYAVRAKKVEAGDLTRSLPLQGSNRQLVSNLKKRTGDHTTSVTVSSSRVSCSVNRTNLEGIVQWAIDTTCELDAGVGLDHFLMNFATPVSYEENRDKLVPTGAYLSLGELEESPEHKIQFVGNNSRSYSVSQSFCGKLFRLGKETFPVVQSDEEYFAEYDGHPLFQVKMNDKSITVAEDWLKRLKVNDGSKLQSLSQYINQKNLLHVSFEDPKLLYANRSLYKDDKIIGDVEGFLKEFTSFEELAGVESEKGSFSPEQTSFSEDSLFYFVENILAEHDSYLVCDDLGDEWADHIGFSLGDVEREPAINFYISKHKPKLTTGASAFHDVVGQAVKNMAKMFLTVEEIEAKYAGIWSQFYQSGGVQTSIPRVRKQQDAFVEDFKQLVSFPNVRRQLYLVVDFISKKDLQEILQKLANSEVQKPHYTQLAWMLSTFINMSREMGVTPKVVCQL